MSCQSLLYCKGKVMPVLNCSQRHEDIRVTELYLDRGEWWTSLPNSFIPLEGAPGTQWIGGRVGPGASLHVVLAGNRSYRGCIILLDFIMLIRPSMWREVQLPEAQVYAAFLILPLLRVPQVHMFFWSLWFETYFIWVWDPVVHRLEKNYTFGNVNPYIFMRRPKI
jgi:hypothetical protein